MPQSHILLTERGDWSDFFGSEILAKRDFFGSMKDTGIFGVTKKHSDYFGIVLFIRSNQQ